MKTRFVSTALFSATAMAVFSAPVFAGKYDNSVLDQVSAAEFIQLLTPSPTSKAFNRTALPRAGDNRCAMSGGRPTSKAIGKLVITGGEGAPPAVEERPATGVQEVEAVEIPYYGNQVATVNLAVRFGNDSDRLSGKDKQLLDELAAAMQSPQLQSATFAVVGHTDATGPLARNLELSCARALSVRNYLINQGVGANRLTPYGFGPERPLLSVAATSPTNRRVEISRAN